MKKVLLVNGSPHEKGCVFTALSEVECELQKNGVETQLYYSGMKYPVQGCIGCGKCFELNKCAFDDQPYNELMKQMKEADGIVIGSPVYYAGANGALCALLDRTFFSGSRYLANKPAAAVVSCRRGGASAAFDRLNKYFTISNMPIVSSQYWNSVHGNTPEDVKQDLEGLQTMRILARNMAWMLNNIENANLPAPERENRIFTNFIR